MKRHPREDDAARPTMKARKLDDSEAVKRKKKKRKTKKKKKKHARSSSSDTSSEDSSCSSDTSISSSEDEKRQKHREKIKKKIKKKEKKEKLKKKHKEEKKKQKSKNKSSPNRAENIEQTFCGPEVPPEILERSRNMAPMTQEEWEKRQSEVKRVLDTETGRYRLIKGDGEVLEEIVSKERHREINKQATAGDGTFFQSQIGWRIN